MLAALSAGTGITVVAQVHDLSGVNLHVAAYREALDAAQVVDNVHEIVFAKEFVHLSLGLDVDVRVHVVICEEREDAVVYIELKSPDPWRRNLKLHFYLNLKCCL
jgi:hypothetical protein